MKNKALIYVLLIVSIFLFNTVNVSAKEKNINYTDTKSVEITNKINISNINSFVHNNYILLIAQAGTPATTTLASTDEDTTAPVPIMALSPMDLTLSPFSIPPRFSLRRTL